MMTGQPGCSVQNTAINNVVTIGLGCGTYSGFPLVMDVFVEKKWNLVIV